MSVVLHAEVNFSICTEFHPGQYGVTLGTPELSGTTKFLHTGVLYSNI